MRAAVVAVAGLLLCGCKSPETRWDRTFEARRPVTFENTEAARTFASARKLDRERRGDTSSFLAGWRGVPHVIESDAGRYNDAVEKCDTNQDGTITYAEAWYYWSLFGK